MTEPTRPRQGFANEYTRPVVEYGPDPNDRRTLALVRDTLTRVQGLLVAPWLGADSDPSTTFHGYGPQLQDFRGAASPAATGVTFRNGGNAEISSGLVEGTQGDPTRRMFADRL